eukprot:1072344-Prymnesium_polylepis.1
MVRRKAVFGRYAVLRCHWHEVRDDERSSRTQRYRGRAFKFAGNGGPLPALAPRLLACRSL